MFKSDKFEAQLGVRGLLPPSGAGPPGAGLCSRALPTRLWTRQAWLAEALATALIAQFLGC